MVNTTVFISVNNKAVIVLPLVSVYCALLRHQILDYSHYFGLGGVLYYLGIDMPVTFKITKDRNLLCVSSAPVLFTSTKVAFIKFHFTTEAPSL